MSNSVNLFEFIGVASIS